MSEIQSLARGLKILEYMAEQEDALGVTEIAERLEVDKATASRMINTLGKYGYVEKAPDGRRYQLGPVLVRLSRSVINRTPLRESARPSLNDLVEITGECAHLAIYAQGQALYIDQVESEATLRVNVEIGHMAPLYCTALGKVLLAYGDYPLPESFEKRTERTITTKPALQTELDRVRAQGYASDDEEFDPGVRCIAVPVFGINNKLIGAIGVSGPASRFSSEILAEIAPQVIGVGKTLSDRLKFKHKG